MITAQTLYTKENFKPAWKAHIRRSGSGYAFYPVFGIILIGSSAVPWRMGSSNFLALWIIFLGLVMLLKPLWIELFFYRNLKKSPVFGKSIRWEIDERELKGSGEGSRFTLEWYLFHEIHESDDGLLIYVHKQMFYWIPKMGFDSEDEYKKVCAIMKENAKKFTARVRRKG